MSNEMIINAEPGGPIDLSDALNKALEAPQLDAVLLSIANDYLAGMDTGDISEQYGISRERVIAVLEAKDVKIYIDGVYQTSGFLNRFKRLALVNKVIESKIADALAAGGDYSDKDILDWLKLLNDMDKTANPKQTRATVAVQVNNYDKLMNDLIK